MAYEFKLPDLGEGLTEGEIARWLVQEGQEIAEDDPLVEIATDKTTVEIPSPAARRRHEDPRRRRRGRSGRHRARRDRRRTAGAAVAPSNRRARPRQADDKVRATPLVRRLAEELGVDLATIAGTGPQGRITEDDVRGGAQPGTPRREGRREPIRGDQAADVRAPHARAPRDPAGHLGRGVRLHRRRPEAAAAARR